MEVGRTGRSEKVKRENSKYYAYPLLHYQMI